MVTLAACKACRPIQGPARGGLSVCKLCSKQIQVQKQTPQHMREDGLKSCEDEEKERVQRPPPSYIKGTQGRDAATHP